MNYSRIWQEMVYTAKGVWVILPFILLFLIAIAVILGVVALSTVWIGAIPLFFLLLVLLAVGNGIGRPYDD